MRCKMIGLVVVLVSATAAMAADVGRPGANYRQGGPLPWCNQGNSVNGGMMECSYYTLEQCLASASGLGGGCITNPAFEWARRYSRRPHERRY